MKHTSSFIFNFEDSKIAKIIESSLLPEIRHKIPKTDIEISLSGKNLILDISSSDISSLRAACNSYLRWINTALNVRKII